MIALPDEIVVDKVKTTLKVGMLCLVLPKAEQTKRKEIEIQVE